MKKIVYAGLALGLMTVVSCQKELTEGQMENTVAQITKTMYVEGNEWIVTDRYPSTVYKKVDGFNKKFSYQDFDFERYFDMLISVKDGYYFTSFKPAS